MGAAAAGPDMKCCKKWEYAQHQHQQQYGLNTSYRTLESKMRRDEDIGTKNLSTPEAFSSVPKHFLCVADAMLNLSQVKPPRPLSPSVGGQ